MNDKKNFQHFTSFLSSYRAAGTYQFVFLKSILYLPEIIDGKKREWGSDWIKKIKGGIQVNLNFFAVPFTKYYWDMFYKFRLRQSAAKNQYGDEDVNIHKFFKKDYLEDLNLDEKPPKHLKELAGTRFDPLRKDVIKKSMREVLRALNDRGFWKKIPQQKRNPKTKTKSGYLSTKLQLTFAQEQIDFFQEYRKLLDTALNYELTLHLEKINPFFPQVAKSVLIEIPRGHLPTKENIEYNKLYKKPGSFDCFYCKTTFPVGNNEPARDHVIPFDFVLSNELYNSVPACKACNGSKSNRLPNEEIFNDVIKRNKTIKNKENYSVKDFWKLYKHCLESYHGDRKLFHR